MPYSIRECTRMMATMVNSSASVKHFVVFIDANFHSFIYFYSQNILLFIIITKVISIYSLYFICLFCTYA